MKTLFDGLIPKRVAIVGSRGFPDEQLVRETVRALPSDTILVSGGALGPDTWSEEEARAIGLKVHVIEAEWDRLGRVAGFRRNTLIAKYADELIAFWDGASFGTADVVAKTRALHKEVRVIQRAPENPTWE